MHRCGLKIINNQSAKMYKNTQAVPSIIINNVIINI